MRSLKHCMDVPPESHGIAIISTSVRDLRLGQPPPSIIRPYPLPPYIHLHVFASIYSPPYICLHIFPSIYSPPYIPLHIFPSIYSPPYIPLHIFPSIYSLQSHVANFFNFSSHSSSP